MSRAGSPDIHVEGVADLRVAVVAAQWHDEIMKGLVEGALRALHDAKIEEPTVVRVPGTFELPVAARALAERGYQAIVALGVVVRGDTPHFDYVCQAATYGLTQVAVTTGVPIGFGVLTCDTVDQAYARAGLEGSREDKGYEAAMAAIATVKALRTVAEPWH
ncbi:6,7-dimethyl-8-ribityllumazine synthase [Carbonactinospora thermoautotrophica]|uniref:6,7-dimethyl-8-ribityllumazine synthase n=1 Tax=Carbonactinospora thermoautotrophica TaxID=1469144 RepID=UPI0022700780|nr:6,7-dimethyl-8-ribityllumazine synthase [Carbonactinospora thermoautotrophica]MCX9192985.1 6,7-dimethyl-8-ribityllumazine synthase [Carbonactinospora thermoautotrophica]